MNENNVPRDEAKALLDQIESGTAQLRELEAGLRDIKVTRKKNWLARLQRAAKQTSKRYQSTLPRLSKQQEDQWTKEASAHLSERSDKLIAALNTVVDRAKGER